MLDKQHIKQDFHAGNVVFEITDPVLFSQTRYKVLIGQDSRCLTECVKTKLNGNVSLVYMTDGFRLIKDCMSTASAKVWRDAMFNLLKALRDIENNGFLNLSDVMLDPDFVFYDEFSESAKIIYLPLKNNDTASLDARSYFASLCTLVQACQDACPPAKKALPALDAFLQSGATCDIEGLAYALQKKAHPQSKRGSYKQKRRSSRAGCKYTQNQKASHIFA